MTAVIDQTATMTLPASVVRDGLSGALVAAGKDSILPTLCAVLVEWDETTVQFAATDRYRLAVGTVSDYPQASSGRILIERNAVANLIKLLPKSPKYGPEPSVALSVLPGSRAVLSVSTGESSISQEFTTLDGEFPKYRTLIPTEPAPVEKAAWNPNYMADAAKIPHPANTPITWEFMGTNRPMLGTYPAHNSIEWLYLLMPSKV